MRHPVAITSTCIGVEGVAVATLFAAFSSLFIFVVVQFSGTWLKVLPMCILASIIIVALLDMFAKFQQLPGIWAISKIDCAVWIVAFLATACIDVMDGLAIAIAFALLTTVFRLQTPTWHILAHVKGTMEYRDVERYQQVDFVQGICIVRFDAPLLFTNVEQFRTMVYNVSKNWNNIACNFHATWDSGSEKEDASNQKRQSAPKRGRFLIIDCSGFVYVDMMGVNCLKEVYEDLLKKNIGVFFAAPKAPVRELFEAAGLYESVKKTNFYPTIHDAMFFAKQRRKEAALASMESNGSSDETALLSNDLSPQASRKY
ncbi:STAS domain protein [Necator americanus]|uniref:STAS domain protein n=1 Tax=Necator americanus TaxID=51031 RepID=W2T9E4_NECAM|nr:STAS domain protein [Necator americanus]ETN77801.1 STAS domain protein [Necator americanus]